MLPSSEWRMAQECIFGNKIESRVPTGNYDFHKGDCQIPQLLRQLQAEFYVSYSHSPLRFWSSSHSARKWLISDSKTRIIHSIIFRLHISLDFESYVL